MKMSSGFKSERCIFGIGIIQNHKKINHFFKFTLIFHIKILYHKRQFLSNGSAKVRGR